VFAISSIGRKLLEKLQKRAYRHAYLAEHVRRGIAHQIRALRNQRGWNQGAFSKNLGKPQSVVCRLEDPSYGKVTIQTLLEVANVYDVALQVRFVPYSAFLQHTRDISTESMKVLSFDDDLASKESKAIRIKPLSEVFGTGIITQIKLETSDDDNDFHEVVPPETIPQGFPAVPLQ
jgi:hypothetical protein